MTTKQWVILGLLILGLGGYYMYATFGFSTSTHPIGYADKKDEVHVHSDFILYLDGRQYDLRDDKYQTTGEQMKHAHIHLHDNNDEVIHRHDHGITLGDFFGSLGFTLTDECITTDADEIFCNEEGEGQLQLYVNGERTTEIAEYVNQEEDRILIFYGPENDPQIETLLSEVTDTACIYSGTCPERGVAPPESCGLFCEL